MSELRKTLALSLPIIVGNLSHTLYGVVDAIMVGTLGAANLAASAFVNGVIMIPTIFVIGMSTAISVLVAQSVGAKEYSNAGKHLWNSIFVLTLLGGVLSLLMVFGVGPFLEIFNQPEEVLEACYGYYYYVASSLVFLAINTSYRKYSEGLGFAISAMVVVGLGVVLNIFFNWIFIFGNFGFEAQGLTGAGIGTILSRACSAAVFIAYVMLAPDYKKYLVSLKDKWLNKVQIRSLLKLGVPSGLQYLFEVGAFACCAIMMGWVGTEALAAHQIVANLGSTTFMIPLGLSFAVSVRVGEAYGQKNLDLAKTIAYGVGAAGSVYMITCGLLFVTFRYDLANLFITDLQVVGIAAELLLIVACFQLVDGMQALALGALRGLSDVNIPTIMTFICYWLVGLPGSYLLGFYFELGPYGIWMGLAIGLALVAIALNWRFYRLINR